MKYKLPNQKFRGHFDSPHHSPAHQAPCMSTWPPPAWPISPAWSPQFPPWFTLVTWVEGNRCLCTVILGNLPYAVLSPVPTLTHPCSWSKPLWPYPAYNLSGKISPWMTWFQTASRLLSFIHSFPQPWTLRSSPTKSLEVFRRSQAFSCGCTPRRSWSLYQKHCSILLLSW